MPNREPLRYGGVKLDAHGGVTGFVARGPSAADSFHFVGPQVVQAEVFRSIPSGSVMRTIGGLYDELIAARPGSVRGFVSNASCWDVGTIADYWATSWALADPQSGASGRSILWNDVQVGAGAVLDECIVTDHVRVPSGRALPSHGSRKHRNRHARRQPFLDRIMTDLSSADVQTRLDSYLAQSGLASRGARVVPLTGDASDRRYFRVLAGDSPSVVLALHVGPIDFATLPFANVAELFSRVPLPVPAILGHSDREGIVELEDLGDVTLQAHLGAATPEEHAALYREAVALIEHLQRRGRELEDGERYLPYRIAFDAEKLRWELDFFTRHFVLGYRGVQLTPAERDGARRRVARDRRRARVGTARALSSRLSQPQPDAPSQPSAHD